MHRRLTNVGSDLLSIQVRAPNETKRLIEAITACLEVADYELGPDGMAGARIGVARLDLPEQLPSGDPADGDGPRIGSWE